jgi:cytochrome oxidase Cu insertion factor (SCO1/SenC/PrrC family)
MAERKPLRRGWVVAAIGVAVAIGGGAGAALALTHGSSAKKGSPAAVSQANVTWKAGRRAAPGFALRDQNGAPISLASYRGRAVIVTFIDPRCTSLCPLEAKVLNQVERQLPASQRTPIVSVSVNPWGNSRSQLLADARKWRLTSDWRWAVGSRAKLARVWRDYSVAVQFQGHEVSHTEGAYLVDRDGYQRALFLWPFAAADVSRAVRNLGS